MPEVLISLAFAQLQLCLIALYKTCRTHLCQAVLHLLQESQQLRHIPHQGVITAAATAVGAQRREAPRHRLDARRLLLPALAAMAAVSRRWRLAAAAAAGLLLALLAAAAAAAGALALDAAAAAAVKL